MDPINESTNDPANAPIQEPDIDQQHRIAEHFRGQQNVIVALLAGFAASLVGAAVWGGITVLTGYKIGLVAIGVGLLVAFAVKLGKGIEPMYQVIGAIFALLGCVLGNFLSVVAFVASYEEINFFTVFAMLDYSKVPNLMIETASPMDLLFYGLAVYEGYKFSLRNISPADLEEAQRLNP